MAKMIVLHSFRYAGIIRKSGDCIDVKDHKHVLLLSALRKARIAEEETHKITKEDMGTIESESPVEEEKPKRRYRRRDMRAENA